MRRIRKLFSMLASFTLVTVLSINSAFAKSSLTMSQMGSASIQSGNTLSLSDISAYCGNYNTSDYAITGAFDGANNFSNEWHHNDDNSRLIYKKLIKGTVGQKIAIVANQADTADAGGENLIGSSRIYWSIGEYSGGGACYMVALG